MELKPIWTEWYSEPQPNRIQPGISKSLMITIFTKIQLNSSTRFHSTRFQNYFIVSIYSQFFSVACNSDDIIDVGDLKVVTIKFGDNKVGDNTYPISGGN